MAHLKQPQIDKAPTLSDLRDSSFIAQESDYVFILWRKIEENTIPPILLDESILSVQKNRRTGKMGNIALDFKNGRLKELGQEIEELEECKEIGDKLERDLDNLPKEE